MGIVELAIGKVNSSYFMEVHELERGSNEVCRFRAHIEKRCVLFVNEGKVEGEFFRHFGPLFVTRLNLLSDNVVDA